MIKDCLKEAIDIDDCWVGAFKMDMTRDKAVCVYRRKVPYRKAVGGAMATGHEVYALSLLVRWGTNGNEADKAAKKIYDSVEECEFMDLEEYGYASMMFDMPVGLGTDERGVYEFSIDFNLYLNNYREEY